MTFQQFLETKYPLYRGADLKDFHLSVAQLLEDHSEWMEIFKDEVKELIKHRLDFPAAVEELFKNQKHMK